MRVQNESFPFVNKRLTKRDLNKNLDEVKSLTGVFHYKLNNKNELIFSDCSNSAELILGINCSQFIGKTIQESFPEISSDIVEDWKETALSGKSWNSSFSKYSDANISGTFEVTVHQVEPGKIIVLFKDITELESVRQEQKKLFNSIYKGVEHIIFIVDVNKDGSFKFTDVNPAYERLSGMEAEKIIGRSPLDLADQVSKENLANVISRYKECVESKKNIKYEELIDFKGVERWWLTTLNPILDDDDEVDQIVGTTFEITDRKNIEHELSEHKTNLELNIEKRITQLTDIELRFRRLGDNIRDGIRIVENGKLVYVNRGFCSISGYSKKELFDLNSRELVHKNDWEWVNDTISKTKHTGNPPDELKFWIKRKDGTERFIHNRYSKWKNADGDFTLYIFTIDITEKEKDKEQLLLQSSALNAAANSITITDSAGKIIWANDSFTSLTQYTREEIIGKNHSVLKSGKQDEKFYENLWSTIKSGKVWRGELQNKQKDGKLYHEEMTITPVKVNGIVTHYIAIKQDISDRKKNETELVIREKKYRSLFSNSHNAILVSDFKGKILEMNQAARDLLGINEENISNLNSTQFILNSNRFTDFLIMLKEKGYVKNFTSQIIKQDKSKLDCLINATLHKSETGDSDVFQAILLDITEQVEAKRILENALDEAEKANNVKSEFLAQMSHEIRTPITVILSYIGLIKSDVIDLLTNDMRELFPSMERASKRIIRTIDLLLNVAELNAGSYQCNFQKIDLYDRVLEILYHQYKKEADAKKLEFTINNQCDQCFINADEHTVAEIFTNLVDNAIKYTPKGKVSINVNCTTDDWVEVEISDSGVGIDDRYIPKLFEPFTQEEMGYTRSYEGNGLGLALAEKYAKLNGGKIKVESKKGEGSKFTVSFKAADS